MQVVAKVPCAGPVPPPSIVVTPDSVNMLSEACATGVPVYTHAPLGVAGRLAEALTP